MTMLQPGSIGAAFSVPAVVGADVHELMYIKHTKYELTPTWLKLYRLRVSLRDRAPMPRDGTGPKLQVAFSALDAPVSRWER